MKLLIVALAAGLAVPATVSAADGKALQLKPKAALETAVAASSVSKGHAPFTFAPSDDLDLDFMPHSDSTRAETPAASCSNQQALCYDAASGRVVYRPAREYMPDLPGLQRENISLKRNSIVFRYSF